MKSRYDEVLQVENSIKKIAVGCCEKNDALEKEPTVYHRSDTLMKGINLFADVGYRAVEDKENYLSRTTERQMYEHYLCKPIKLWFNGWDRALVAYMSEMDWWDVGPLVVKIGDNRYRVTKECVDIATGNPNSLLTEHV